jgi:hypothetical protein
MAFTRVVKEKYPDETHALDWQGLKRFLMPDNKYRWLHAPKEKEVVGARAKVDSSFILFI